MFPTSRSSGAGASTHPRRDNRPLRVRSRQTVRSAESAEAAAIASADPLEADTLRALATKLWQLSSSAGPRLWALR